MKAMRVLAALGAVALAASPAAAQGAGQTRDGWQFSLTPHLWLAGASGEVASPRNGTKDFAADFSDTLGSLKFGAMATFEARRDRFAIVVDFMTLDIEEGFNTPRSIAVSNGEARMSTTQLAVVGLVRAIDTPGYSLDVGGFETGSKLTWQAIGAVDWRITPSIAARAGWRYLYVD